MVYESILITLWSKCKINLLSTVVTVKLVLAHRNKQQIFVREKYLSDVIIKYNLKENIVSFFTQKKKW